MTTMQVKGVWKMRETHEYVFNWTIYKLNTLKKNVSYWNYSDKLGWKFTIMKKANSAHVITISPGTDYEEDITCFVRYDEDVFSRSSTARKVDGGLHQVTFTNSVIYTPENQFLQCDLVIFTFSFNRSQTSRLAFQPRVRKDRCRYQYMKMHTKLLLTMHQDRGTSDFILHCTEGGSYEVHKAVLAARSPRLRIFIQKHCKDGETGEIRLDLTSDLVYMLLSFLYSGQVVLRCKEELIQFCELLPILGLTMRDAMHKLSVE